MHREENRVKKGSGDIFKDSDVPNANEEFMKARFASIIRDVIVERGLEVDQAAETLDMSKSEAAALLKCEFSNFSLNCLLSFLEKLGFYMEFIAHEIPPGESPKGLRISTSF